MWHPGRQTEVRVGHLPGERLGVVDIGSTNDRAQVGIAIRKQCVRDHVESDERHVKIDVAYSSAGVLAPTAEQPLCCLDDGWHEADEVVMTEHGCCGLPLPF